jgi:multiple sugar transport system permease protein
MSSTRSSTGGRIGLGVATAVVFIFVMAPMYWLVSTAFKTSNGVSSATPQWWPNPITWTNFVDVFTQFTYGRYIVNSLVVAIVSTALVLFFGTLAGYAFAKMPIRGKMPLLVILLIISVFPGIAVIAPLYTMMRALDWLNSYQALIVPYTALNLPFAIWILRNYFLGVPNEIEESARIDGAGPTRTLFTVVLPMALPGLFTAGIFAFTACWTEFLMALSFNSQNNYRTIPVGTALFATTHTTPYGLIFAGATVAIVPIAILVFVFRKAVVSGLTSGAVKG